jgi:midasin (ATPase involved in ribosome maturation)
MSVDLQAVIDQRKQGKTWEAIAKSVALPESTLRGRLRVAGLLQRKAKGAKAVAQAAATAVPPAAAPAVASSNFVAPTWYPLLRYAMEAEKGASLFGPRGCGKSTAIRQLAGEMTRSTVTLQCAANMQIDSLLGSWTSQAGTLSFVDGPLTAAVRAGAWLLAEEANVIHPGVWSLVNTLTDTTGEGLRLPSGEIVPQTPGFRLILIYNEGYTGTREVNAALKDRLMPIYCDYLPAAEEVTLLEKMTGAAAEQCKRVQEVAAMIRAANLRFDLSPRSLVRWIRLVKVAGLTWGQAYERAILDLVGPPQLAAPQRSVLEEIARNTVAQWPA